MLSISVQYIYSSDHNKRVLNLIYHSEFTEDTDTMKKNEKAEENTMVAVPEIFSYEYFQSHRYQITNQGLYEALCNNGFIKLYTLKTRVYWHAQNQFEHRVPDWKFHVSVHLSDVKRAWDIIVGIFLKMKCRGGMKVIYLKQSQNPQIGRQITIYIYKYSKRFEESSFAKQFQISISDEHSEQFWQQFVINIENALSEYNLKSNGLADGDYKIGNYVSLRNQAFVKDANSGNYIYPPNNFGWNGLNQDLPLNLAKFVKRVREGMVQHIEKVEGESKKRPMYYFALPIMFITVGLFAFKKLNAQL